ncbi:MAG: hypothetical protein ACLP1X_22050, partial [Polyangiaceae bacterium]
MNDNDSMAVGRILDFDPTRFNNVQIDLGLTGPKDYVALSVVARGCHGLDHRQFRASKPGKR